ncbi:MAG: hypothetical protein GX568_00155, partial [Candidatus Gastranaerophilales bacterium]|nr:hypothetical protein [Candidatus Gastranaerophilales bacterium]
MNSNVIYQFVMMALNGQLGNTAVLNPKTETIVSSLKDIQGRDKKTSFEEVEKQISIFDNQLSTMQIFASIPQFAPVISPMLANIKEQKAALELVYDNFDAFAGEDGYIDKGDFAAIREAAECDGNGNDFSKEDLEDIYDINGVEYDPEEDFSFSKIKFDSKVSSKTGSQTRKFDDAQSEKNIHIKDNRGDDTYIVSEEVEDSNLVFTELDKGDKLELKGKWSIKEVYDEEAEEEYVMYTNEETGTNVFVKGSIDDVYDQVNVEKLDKDFSKFDAKNPEKT